MRLRLNAGRSCKDKRHEAEPRTNEGINGTRQSLAPTGDCFTSFAMTVLLIFQTAPATGLPVALCAYYFLNKNGVVCFFINEIPGCFEVSFIEKYMRAVFDMVGIFCFRMKRKLIQRFTNFENIIMIIHNSFIMHEKITLGSFPSGYSIKNILQVNARLRTKDDHIF
jgi:hypothetical protein